MITAVSLDGSLFFSYQKIANQFCSTELIRRAVPYQVDETDVIADISANGDLTWQKN